MIYAENVVAEEGIMRLLQCMMTDIGVVFTYVPNALLLGAGYTVCCLMLRRIIAGDKQSVSFFYKKIFWMSMLFVIYMGVLLETVFFSREPGSRMGTQMQLMGTWGVTMQDHAWVLENVLLFLPFGMLFPTILPHRWRKITILVGGLCSACIEWIQLCTGRGFCQLDDIVMNTLGAGLGLFLYDVIAVGLSARKKRRKRFAQRRPERRVRQTRQRCCMIAGCIWMAVIFGFSAQPATESTGTSLRVGRMVCSLFVYEYGSMSWEQQNQLAQQIEFPVRKSAHMTEYAVLAVLWMGAFSGERLCRRDAARAVFLAICYAATDEVHQLFVEGRSGQLRDVMIDGCGAFLGAAAGMLLLKAAQHLRRRIKEGEYDGR